MKYLTKIMKNSAVDAIQMLDITKLVLKGGSVRNFENSDIYNK